MGLDIRSPISSTLTLDLTVNSDFAQVEADDQQVKLDRFPLFYPERRRLFQEGNGIDFTGATGSRRFTPGGSGSPMTSRRFASLAAAA